MDAIKLEGSYNTPRVSFDPSSGILELEGRSIPEHANMFFRPLIDWVKEYGENSPPATTLEVRLEYLNSSSTKFLLELFEKLEPIHANGVEMMVNWYYEEDDEEMMDAGEEYDEAVEVPFTIISVDEF